MEEPIPAYLKTNDDKLDWLAAKFEAFAQCIFSHLQPHYTCKKYSKSTYDKDQDVNPKREAVHKRLSLVWLELQKLEEDDMKDPGAWCRPLPRVRTSRQVTPIEEDFWSNKESTKHYTPTPSTPVKTAIPMTAWTYNWEAQCYVENHSSREDDDSLDGLSDHAQTPGTPPRHSVVIREDVSGNCIPTQPHLAPISHEAGSTGVDCQQSTAVDIFSKRHDGCSAVTKLGFSTTKRLKQIRASQRKGCFQARQTDVLPMRSCGVTINRHGKRRAFAQCDGLSATKRTKFSYNTRLDGTSCRPNNHGYRWQCDQGDQSYDADDDDDDDDDDDEDDDDEHNSDTSDNAGMRVVLHVLYVRICAPKAFGSGQQQHT
ncbi:hypothetical protein KC330_g7552 [Hortaea werneckii]|nr:hypothetical protein KC330_g7552 [Hortaea werneckii]